MDAEKNNESPSEKIAKKKSYKKKVEKDWTQEQILQFIQEIETRRSLWDAGCAEYKLPKDTIWQDIGDAIGMTVNECKAKWSNLRTTFNCNLEKMRKKKSGQGTSDNVSISWKFFKPMLFLEANKVLQSTEPTSSLELSTASGEDRSFLKELVGQDTPNSPPTTMTGRKRNRSVAYSTPNSSQEEKQDLRKMAVEALVKMRTNNTNVLFGEYLASELNALPEDQSHYVRSVLRDAFNLIMKHLPAVFPNRLEPHQVSFELSSNSNDVVYICDDQTRSEFNEDESSHAPSEIDVVESP